jgi:hypothetical protein
VGARVQIGLANVAHNIKHMTNMLGATRLSSF